MKHFGLKSFLTLIIAAIVPVSCSKDRQEPYGNNMTYLPIDDIQVHPLGDVIPVSYTSESSWEIDVNWRLGGSDWITITGIESKKGPSGTTRLEISVEPCITEDRQAVISFLNGDVELDSFVIAQKKAFIEVPEDEYILEWKSSDAERNITVKSNIQWEISLDNTTDFTLNKDDSVQGEIKKDFSSTDVDVNINAVANNLDRFKKNKAQIKIVPVKTGYDGKPVTNLSRDILALTKTINISQNNLIFSVENIDGNEITELRGFHELGYKAKETYSAELNEVSDGEFKKSFKVVLEEGYDWDSNMEDFKDVMSFEEVDKKSVSSEGRKEYETSIELTWNAPNPKREEETKKIIFWIVDEEGNSVDGTELELTATQNPYCFEVTYDNNSAQKEYKKVIPNMGGTATLALKASGPWNLEEKLPDWILVIPESGFGDADVTVVVEKQNLDFESKSYSSAIETGLNDLTVLFDVNQKEFRFDVAYVKDTPAKGISRMDTNPYVVTVTSDGPWTLEVRDGANSHSAGQWLDVAGVECEEDSDKVIYRGQACEELKLNVKASEYATTSTSEKDDRSKILNFQSTLHSEEQYGSEGNHVKALDFIQQSLRTLVLEPNRDGDFTVPETFKAYCKTENRADFYINCSAPWLLSATGSDGKNVPWISFKDTEGNALTGGDGTVYKDVAMVVETNESDANRTADVKVIVTIGSETKTISLGRLTQDGFVFDVKYVKFAEFEALNQTEVSITVTSTDDAPWTVECPDWIGSPSNNAGTSIINFKPGYNGTLEPRSDYAVIKSDVTGKTHKISFKQKAYEFDEEQVVLKEFDELTSQNSAQDVKVICTGDWTVKNKPDWITVSPMSGSGTRTLKVTTSQDHTSTDKERSGQFLIVSKVDDVLKGAIEHAKQINVSQHRYTWTVTGMKDISLDALEEDEVTVNVTSSGDWTASLAKDVAKLSITEEKGDKDNSKTVTLTIDKNYTLADREDEMVVQSAQYDSKNASHLRETMKIRQAAYVFKVSVDNMEFEAKGGSKEVKNLECSGNLNIGSKPAWIKKSEIKNGALTVEAEENKDTKERKGEITIESEHVGKNSNLKKTITVTQKAAEKK